MKRYLYIVLSVSLMSLMSVMLSACVNDEPMQDEGGRESDPVGYELLAGNSDDSNISHQANLEFTSQTLPLTNLHKMTWEEYDRDLAGTGWILGETSKLDANENPVPSRSYFQIYALVFDTDSVRWYRRTESRPNTYKLNRDGKYVNMMNGKFMPIKVNHHGQLELLTFVEYIYPDYYPYEGMVSITETYHHYFSPMSAQELQYLKDEWWEPYIDPYQ